jgi:hypothetical protein
MLARPFLPRQSRTTQRPGGQLRPACIHTRVATEGDAKNGFVLQGLAGFDYIYSSSQELAVAARLSHVTALPAVAREEEEE